MVSVMLADGYRLTGGLVRVDHSSHGEFGNVLIRIEDRPVLIRGSMIIAICKDRNFLVKSKVTPCRCQDLTRLFSSRALFEKKILV